MPLHLAKLQKPGILGIKPTTLKQKVKTQVTIGKRPVKTLENLRSTLRSKQPKADGKLAMLINSPPFCVAWHNKALGSIDEINWFNRWYGDEPRYGRNSVTLLFPTAYAYKCTAKNKEELEKIVANPKNWKYDKYCNDKKRFIFTNQESQIQSFNDYYTYLQREDKI